MRVCSAARTLPGAIGRLRCAHDEKQDGLILEELQFGLRNLLRRRGFEVVGAGRPEADLLALHLDRLFDRLAVNVVLDVGAGGGDFGRLLRRNGYAGRIASFEPVSDSFDWLRRHSAADHRWDAFLAGPRLRAWRRRDQRHPAEGVQFVSRTQHLLGGGAWRGVCAGNSSPTVPVRRLDGVAESALGDISEPRAYLKMDTQGWDLQVLEGASGCLERVVAIQSEVSVRPNYRGLPSMRESLERFELLGFGVSGLFPVALDSNLEVEELDFVAVRRDAVRKHGSAEALVGIDRDRFTAFPEMRDFIAELQQLLGRRVAKRIGARSVRGHWRRVPGPYRG